MNKHIRLSFAASLLAIFLFGASTLAATSSPATDEFAGAKALISQGVSCQQLSTEQLDSVGDYYMEQMMPGTAHENMEKILGGEGSESLKQMHILMARRWYCGDAIGMGMMGMMVGPGVASNIGGRGMMGQGSGYNNFNRGYGMMGYGNGSMWGFGGGLFMLASAVLIVVAIAALVKYLLKK